MKSENYISGVIDYDSENVLVWTRNEEGRVLKRFPCPYYFYVPDNDGTYESLFGDKLTRLDFDSHAEFEYSKTLHKKRFESDISPLDKVLMENFYKVDSPKIHYSFLDIEVDYKQELGFSSPQNPYAAINAVTVYHQWLDEFVTVAVPPKEWKGDTQKEFDSIMPEINTTLIIVRNELELLTTLLEIIEDSDLLSGWNSDFFDMPYLVRRTELVLGKNSMKKWCFVGAKAPYFKEVNRFGGVDITVKLSGRVHLDYLQLFQKFTFEGRSSWALAAIAEEELDIPKLDYEGTLEELYHNDFIHFLKYNVRDTEILKRLDEKFNFIALANQMAHSNTVPFDAVLGTVKFVQTGIINYAHNVLNKIVHDNQMKSAQGKVEGAIVMTPKIGLHEWIGSCDINSLYPSTIRSLNMSSETIIGQFSNGEVDWEGIWKQDDKYHTLCLENGEELYGTGIEWNEVLRAKKWAVSAYGTVFDQSGKNGVVAAVLTAWFAERKSLQKQKKEWTSKLKELEKNDASKSDIQHAKEMVDKFDLLQLTMKIQLNSTYGALLNEWFLFFDQRMGASVTATGRQITTHMIQVAGESITGEFYPLVKQTEVDDDGKVTHVYTSECPAIIYGDTDSCYFITFASSKPEAIEIADFVAGEINNSFKQFMREAFLCNDGYDDLIKAARELVGERGLFQAKKKYVIKIVDLDGNEVVKLKSMGSEVKKSDTPKIIQKFLKEVLNKILDGANYSQLENFVNTSRKRLFKGDEEIIFLGIAKQVNNLNKFYDEWKRLEATGKKRVNLPGHVRASINFNEYSRKIDGPGAHQIKSGDKILIFYLKENLQKFTSIAIPADYMKFPTWFKDFVIDVELTEQKMVDAKLEGIFRAMGWDVPTHQGSHVNKILTF